MTDESKIENTKNSLDSILLRLPGPDTCLFCELSVKLVEDSYPIITALEYLKDKKVLINSSKDFSKFLSAELLNYIVENEADFEISKFQEIRLGCCGNCIWSETFLNYCKEVNVKLQSNCTKGYGEDHRLMQLCDDMGNHLASSRGKSTNVDSIIEFKINISEGIDPCNLDNTTTIEIKAFNTMTLLEIHQEIMKKLDIEEENLIYLLGNGNVIEDLNIKLRDIEFDIDDKTIILDKKKTKRKSKSQSIMTSDQSNDDENLSVFCTTRILGSDGEPLPKVRIIVQPKQECKEMMEAVSQFWKKVNLKFKIGRIVLKDDKTFLDQGIEEGTEVVVTGGRG